MIKKTLLAVTISTTLISGVAFAAEGNDTGVLTSATTAPSVGYRPVAVAGEEGLEVKGMLYIGQTLRIDKLFYTDKDGDGIDNTTGKGESVLDKSEIKWFLINKNVNNPDLSGTPSHSGTQFEIPKNASQSVIWITYKVAASAGHPYQAFSTHKIKLTSKIKGLEGGTDGIITNRASNVSIIINNPGDKNPSNELNGTDSINSPIVGATLSTKCSFKDDEKSTASNCDSEGYSFQWFSANELNGIYTKIDNASNSTYTIPSDQQNLYFKVELTPLTINDSKTPPVVAKKS